jgi:hypothetical protein
MKIGSWDMMQAVQTNPLFLLDELIATGNAQAREEQFAQVIEQPEVHRSVLTVWVSEISVKKVTDNKSHLKIKFDTCFALGLG